jgi:hypothetical protein
MVLQSLINKSIYGTIGYISSQNDLDLLEQYIIYNLPILKEYKQIIVATNYKNYPEYVEENTQLWRKYFSECILLDNNKNRGPAFGTADLDDLIFDYCKENNIEWLCKSANDIILQLSILEKEIKEADFYYLNGIGYGGMIKYDFNFDKIIEQDFYPQTNFYFINVLKCDYLNDKNHIDEIYNKIKIISDYNGKAWEYGFRSCEGLLSECVNRNKLSKYHLLSLQKYLTLLNLIQHYKIHDPSHKNIMIDGICHFQHSNNEIIQI